MNASSQVVLQHAGTRQTATGTAAPVHRTETAPAGPALFPDFDLSDPSAVSPTDARAMSKVMFRSEERRVGKECW